MPGAHLSVSYSGLNFSFYLLVLTGKIPLISSGAGRVKSRKELVKLESISLLVLAIAISVVVLKMSCLNSSNHPTVIKIGVWILFGFFTLNTLSNLTAKSRIEKYGFGTFTLRIALLMLRLALEG